MMERSEAIGVLARWRGDSISVAAMQAIMAWHEAGQATKNHLDALGCMGSASSLALGIALARPQRRVIVLDGDGCVLMQLGSLVTIAGQAPRNLYHFIFENGRYETSGNQELPGFGRFDLCQMGRAAGYRQALSFDEARQMEVALPQIFAAEGPALVRLAISPGKPMTSWPRVSMNQQIRALRASFLDERSRSES